MSRRLAVLLTSLAACALATATEPAPAAPADPTPMLLRLADFGPGYVVEARGLSAADHPCLSLRPATRVMSQVRGLAPFRGCWLSFERAWTVPGAAPGPESVESLAFAFDDPSSARSMLVHADGLASRLFGIAAHVWHRADAPTIGDEAALWRGGIDIYGPGLRRHRVAIALVAWRSGSTLGLLLADGNPSSDASVQTALRFAAVQQARIAMPTPLSAPVNDDRLVLLDDPGLAIPVVWLGERLPARGRLPALRLDNTDDWSSVDQHPKPRMRLSYRVPHLGAPATIELWRPRDLRRRLAHLSRRYACHRRFAVPLSGAHAWIRATSSRVHGRCGRRAVAYTAIAFFDDVGVTVDATACCRVSRAPYDSRTGLRAVLRALRPREPRRFAP